MWDMSEGELAEYIAANLGPYQGEDDYQIGFCQNCNKELEIEQAKAGKLYCSEKCNQIAGTVRYGRKALKDGRWHFPDVQEAIRMRIAHILGGGYPENARRVPPERGRLSLQEISMHVFYAALLLTLSITSTGQPTHQII